MKNSILSLTVMMLAAVLLSAPSLRAQEQAPSMLMVTEVQAYPDKAATLEELVGSFVVPGVKKAGTSMTTWRSVGFGVLNTYAFVSPLESFASLDATPPWIAAVGQERASRFYSQVRQTAMSVRTIAVRFRPELSYLPDGDFNMKKALIYTGVGRGGKQRQIEEMFTDSITPAYKKLGIALLVHQVVFGSNPNEWVVLVDIDKFADLDAGPPLLRALGPEKFAEFQEEFAKTFTDELNIEFSEVVPELSVQ